MCGYPERQELQVNVTPATGSKMRENKAKKGWIGRRNIKEKS